MTVERKKAELKPVNKLEPKKRTLEVENTIVPEQQIVEQITQEIEVKEIKSKVKAIEHKYARLSMDAKMDERKDFVEKVKNGELRFAYYAIDNDKGYHYYIVIKK